MGLEIRRERGSSVPRMESPLLEIFRKLTGISDQLSADRIGYVTFPCVGENANPIRLQIPQTNTSLMLNIQSYDGIPQPETIAHVAVIPAPDTHKTGENFFELFVARNNQGQNPETLAWNKLGSIASDNGKVTVKYDEHDGMYSTISIPSGNTAEIKIITRSSQWIIEGQPGTEIHMPELV